MCSSDCCKQNKLELWTVDFFKMSSGHYMAIDTLQPKTCPAAIFLLFITDEARYMW